MSLLCWVKKKLLLDGPLGWQLLKFGPLSVCLVLIGKAYKGERSESEKKKKKKKLTVRTMTDKTCGKGMWLTWPNVFMAGSFYEEDKCHQKKSIKSKTSPKAACWDVFYHILAKKNVQSIWSQRSDAAQINREGETFDKRTDGASVTFAFSFE